MKRVVAWCVAVSMILGLGVASASATSARPAAATKFSDERLTQALLTYEEVASATGLPAEPPRPEDYCYSNGCARAWYNDATGLAVAAMEIRQFPNVKQAREFFYGIQRNGNPAHRKYNSRSPARVVYTDPGSDRTGQSILSANGVQRRGKLVFYAGCNDTPDRAAEVARCAESVLSALGAKAKKVLGS